MGTMVRSIAVSWIAGAMSFAETITVQVHNVAGAPAAVIAKAEQGASFVFRGAGISVRWADCRAVDLGRGGNQICVKPDDPYTFMVVIGGRFAKSPLKNTALGFALPLSGTRNHAEIFYPRLKEVTHSNPGRVDDGGLLGAVLVHEIAHLLFGSTSHGPGIMRADWTSEEFKRIGQRQFLFTPEQAEALRTGLRSIRRWRP